MNKTKLQLLAAAVIGGSALLSLASCGKKGQAPMDTTLEIAVAEMQPVSTDISTKYAASIKGKTDVAVRPMVSGFVTSVLVDEGQYVTKGQTLFTIDRVQFQAAVDQAEAMVNAARTQVETARLTASNKKQLFDKNIISQFEYDVAKNNLASAEASLAQANAALSNARKNLSYTNVTAPSNGFVGTIPNREGTLASPSMAQPLTTVSDNGEVYAYFSMNEKDLLELTDGGRLTLNQAIAQLPPVNLILADGTVYPEQGHVATVSGVIDQTTGSANLRARFANTNGMLRSGSTGMVTMPHALDSVYIVPQRATKDIQGQKFVYALTDSNTVHATPIQVYPQDDGQNYIVVAGLTPGMKIAVEGAGSKLQEGMAIKPVDAAEMAARAAAMQQPGQGR